MSWLKRKIFSRKFLAVVGVCTAAAVGAVPVEQCVQVVSVWLFAEGAVDAAHAFKSKED